MAINKVDYNGRTLIDLTEDTVTSETLLSGQTAHDRSGQAIEGSLSLDPIQSGLAIIVDGDTASMAVPVGGYAYIKNNTHGLTEGLYKNTSSSAFPISGGTADGTVFASVSRGGLNDLTLDDASAYGEVGPVPIASIQDALPLNAESLVVDIEPAQDLHGYQYPWPAGGGKNKVEAVGQWYIADGGIVASASGNTSIIAKITRGHTYTVSRNDIARTPQTMGFYSTYPEPGVATYNGQKVVPSSATFTAPINGYVMAKMANSIQTSGWQIELGTTATNYVPYSNICPISGWTGANVVVSPATNAQDGTTITITFPTTAYGGTLDVVNGDLTINRAIVDLGTLTWNSYTGTYPGYYTTLNDMVANAPAFSSTLNCSSYRDLGAMGISTYFSANYDKSICRAINDKQIMIQDTSYATPADFKSAMSGVKLVYELATPIISTFTPEQIKLLQGENKVWADCGKTTVGYWRDDSLSINKAITERAYDKQQGEALADDVNVLSSAMTYVVSGNKSIETATIPVGAYVRLVGSTIAGRSDGIYTVATAIPVDTAIDGTYFNESAPIPGGGLNALNASICSYELLYAGGNTNSSTVPSLSKYKWLLLVATWNNVIGVSTLIPREVCETTIKSWYANHIDGNGYKLARLTYINDTTIQITAINESDHWSCKLYGIK